MKNEKLLLDMNPYTGTKKNYKNKIFIKKYTINDKITKCITVKLNKKIITGKEINELVQLLQYTVEKYKMIKFPILIDIGNTEFSDKMVYVILECMVHVLIDVYCRQVYLVYKVKHSIWTEGFKYSCINNAISGNSLFEKNFLFDLKPKHFRRVFTYEDYCDRDKLSVLMTEIKYFLKNNLINPQIVDELSEVLVELVGNSGEHAKTDCLIDLDLTDETYKKKPEDSDLYYGLNVCVINFSEELFYQPLQNKMSSEDISGRYNNIKEAMQNHKRFFDENYTERDFYMVSSFQDKISGSRNKSATGGRGLSRLICSLGERAADQLCYIASGNRALFFFKEFMKFNKDEFIGFNKDNDYINSIPEKSVLNSVPTYLPGTMYNLSFVINTRSEINE